MAPASTGKMDGVTVMDLALQASTSTKNRGTDGTTGMDLALQASIQEIRTTTMALILEMNSTIVDEASVVELIVQTTTFSPFFFYLKKNDVLK